MIRVEVDTGLDIELMELVEEVETILYKETVKSKVILFADQDEIKHIESDIHKIIAERDKIKKVYDNVGYAYQAIEILRSEPIENHYPGSESVNWSSK